jgi:serine/threonine protein kinase
VAVKVLRAELMADREVVIRFVRERSVLASISHPDVVGSPT